MKKKVVCRFVEAAEHSVPVIDDQRAELESLKAMYFFEATMNGFSEDEAEEYAEEMVRS